MNTRDDREDDMRTKMELSVLKRMFAFLGPYTRPFYANLVCSVLATMSNLAGPQLVKIGIDRYITTESQRGIFIISGIYLGNLFVWWMLSVAQVRGMFRIGHRVLNDIRMAAFRKVQSLSMKFFDRAKTGRIISRIDSDIDSMEQVMVMGFSQLTSNVLVLIGAFSMMVTYHAKLTMIISCVFPLLMLATYLFRLPGRKLYLRSRFSLSRILSTFAENITGMPVIQSLCREDENMKQFKDVVETHNVIMRKVAVLWGLYIPGLGFLGNIGTLIILWYGGYKVLDGDLSIGALTAFLLYLGMFFGPIHVLGELYNQALAAVAGAGRVFDLLDTPVEIADRENARAVPCIQGAVSFEHVFLRYSDDEQSPWVLEDISFQARSGQTIALVGPTGGGKSSILNLLVRFYEPQRGQICIDDIPVHDITLESLHRQTAIVQQDNFLFTGTVMDNIRYGRPDASDESVIDAARATGAHALIARMDKGYHTQVRERGAALSQGERQLICITRALLADPRILILDEATSAVDTHTEKILQGALETLFQDRTVFVVAHRLSTIRNADQVMVIHHGRIVERGTHAHLLACNGMYTGMHRQFAQLVPS